MNALPANQATPYPRLNTPYAVARLVVDVMLATAARMMAAPGVVGGLLVSKLVTKTFGLWPVTRFFRYPRTEAAYATLLMSTGLTFGSISALFGLTHRIIDQFQYSYLIGTVIASAVVPTLVANAFFVPRYLLPEADVPSPTGPMPRAVALGEREG
jgi:glutathione-regulated potassium-efflux system ancillary protein KefC